MDKWTEIRLGEFLTLKRGYDLPNHQRVDNGSIPVISSSGIFCLHDEAKVSPPGVVTGRYGSVGAVFYVDKPFWPLNTTLYVEDFKGNDALFTYFLLQTLDFKKYSGKTSIPGVNRNDLHHIKIFRPPLLEQQKIAEMLSTWDEAIIKVERLITTIRERKKGLMQRLLSGDVRFSGFKEKWCETELGDFFNFFSKKNATNEDLTILSCSTIHGIVQQSVIFGKRIASEDIRRYKVVERGDLIFDPMLLWDASIGFLEVVDKGVISPAYSTFKFKKNSGNQLYFKYLLKTHFYRQQYKFISQGTNVRRRKAPVEAFLKLPVRLPATIEEQNTIVAVLQECDREIDLYSQKLEALKQQKKGLMQKLLTGQIRVKV